MGSRAFLEMRGDKEIKKRRKGLRSVKRGYPSRYLIYVCVNVYEKVKMIDR